MSKFNIDELLRRMRINSKWSDNPPRAALRKAQGRKCFYCFRPINRASETKDHVTPLAAGGGSAGNVVLACKKCNWHKADSLPTNEQLGRLREVHKRAWQIARVGNDRAVAYAERLDTQAMSRRTPNQVPVQPCIESRRVSRSWLNNTQEASALLQSGKYTVQTEGENPSHDHPYKDSL